MAQAVRRYSRKPTSSAKLPAVKDMLYHPALPTLRHMDRDDVMRKLPIEHCRTTTTCSRDDFLKMRSSLVNEGGPGMNCKSTLSKDVQQIMQKYKPVQVTHVHHTQDWNRIMSKMNAHVDKSAGSEVPEIRGLAVRKKHPNITSSWVPWQYIRPATAMDGLPKWHGQKALPTALYARYRRQSYGTGIWR